MVKSKINGLSLIASLATMSFGLSAQAQIQTPEQGVDLRLQSAVALSAYTGKPARIVVDGTVVELRQIRKQDQCAQLEAQALITRRGNKNWERLGDIQACLTQGNEAAGELSFMVNRFDQPGLMRVTVSVSADETSTRTELALRSTTKNDVEKQTASAQWLQVASGYVLHLITPGVARSDRAETYDCAGFLVGERGGQCGSDETSANPAPMKTIWSTPIDQEILEEAASNVKQRGSAKLRCEVSARGELSNCQTLTEAPKDKGIASAAMSLTSYGRVQPRKLLGAPVAGGIVEPVFNFSGPVGIFGQILDELLTGAIQ